MWVPRTSDETEKWNQRATKEAHTGAWIITVLAWAGISALFSAGWFASVFGVVVSQNLSGSFWTRLPLAILITSPFAWLLFRRELAKELEDKLQMSICPKCEKAGVGNSGTVCECGENIVLQSSVKWVEGVTPEQGS